MAITILPAPTSSAQNIGTGFGSGFSQGLALLANMKMKEFQEQSKMRMRQDQISKAAPFLKGILPGLTNEAIDAAKYMPQSIYSGLLHNLKPKNEATQEQIDLLVNSSDGMLSPERARAYLNSNSMAQKLVNQSLSAQRQIAREERQSIGVSTEEQQARKQQRLQQKLTQQQPKKITKDIAQQFMQKAKGNPDIARKMAIQNGYEI